MDMWTPYREAVESTLHGEVVVDRYHVVRMANKGLDEFRKSLKVSMTPAQKRHLMRDRYILLRRNKDLTAQDKLLLDTWLSNIPLLGRAYVLKGYYYLVPTAHEARPKSSTASGVMHWPIVLKLVPYFDELTTAVGNWHDPIFNYFDFQITNGYTEAMNGLIKIANRIGRGYSFEAIRAKMLFRNGHKKSLPSVRAGGDLKKTSTASYGWMTT